MKKSDNRKIVIIGGGVIGLGIAYHLAKLGVTDVLLIERHQLTSGTSWHAAGIVGPLRATLNMTKLASYAVELFPRLESETGQATGFTQTGGYWLAQHQGRLDELHRIATMGERCDIEAKVISTSCLKGQLPWMDTTKLHGALYVPSDSQANPVDICMAYRKGAQSSGIELREGVECVGINTRNKHIYSVSLSDGAEIRCDSVINCAGAWAREVGRLANVPVPLQAVQHMYVVTEPCPILPQPMPIVRDLDSGMYFKGDAGRAVFGGFEPNAICFDVRSEQARHPYIELPEDWNQFEPFMIAALNLVPALANIGVQRFMNGPESFTPDSKPLLGESPYLGGFFVAAGMNSTGMMSSAGIGRAMAEWVCQGSAPMDLWEVDIARFDKTYATSSYLIERMRGSVSDVFAMHWPLKQSASGRNLFKLPIHDEFEESGAVFASMAGWERPLWFASSPKEHQIEYSYREQNWWPYVKREVQCLSSSAVIFDLSPFTKIDVCGSDSVAFLQWVCSCDVDIEIGSVKYGQMLNTRGGIEADVSISRISATLFRITSGAATRLKDIAWLEKQKHNSDMNVLIKDCTFNECVLALTGPRSREILSRLLGFSVDNSLLPFSRWADFELHNTSVRITRLSFAGELGFELACLKGNAQFLYTKMLEAGCEFTLGPAGQLCLDACRLEKGYRHFGHDIGPDDTPLEAGLGFCVDWNKKDFIGKQALLAQKLSGVMRHLVMFEVLFESESQPILLHDEPIFRDDRVVGFTTSGGRGFRSAKSICFAYINFTAEFLEIRPNENYFTIELNGEKYPVKSLDYPPYDPENSRMKS